MRQPPDLGNRRQPHAFPYAAAKHEVGIVDGNHGFGARYQISIYMDFDVLVTRVVFLIVRCLAFARAVVCMKSPRFEAAGRRNVSCERLMSIHCGCPAARND